MGHDGSEALLDDETLIMSSARIRPSTTAARMRATVIAANKIVNPMADENNGHNMLEAIVELVRPIEAG